MICRIVFLAGRGKLKTHPGKGKPILPKVPVKACKGLSETVQCFRAGEGRVVYSENSP